MTYVKDWNNQSRHPAPQRTVLNCRIDSCGSGSNGFEMMRTRARRKYSDLSLPVRQDRSWRDFGAWLGAILFALNIMVGSVGPALNAFGEPLEICSAHGLVGAEPGQPVPIAQEHCQDCPCCLPLLHGGVIPPLALVLAPMAQEIDAVFAPSDQLRSIPARRPDSAAPRAPPVA